MIYEQSTIQNNENIRLRWNETGEHQLRQLRKFVEALQLQIPDLVGATAWGSQTKAASTKKSDVDCSFFVDVPLTGDAIATVISTEPSLSDELLDELGALPGPLALELSFLLERALPTISPSGLEQLVAVTKQLVATIDSQSPHFFENQQPREFLGNKGSFYIFNVADDVIELLIRENMKMLKDSEDQRISEGSFSADSYVNDEFRRTYCYPLYRLFMLGLGSGIAEKRRVVIAAIENAAEEPLLQKAMAQVLMRCLAREERATSRGEIEYGGYPKTLAEIKHYFHLG